VDFTFHYCDTLTFFDVDNCSNELAAPDKVPGEEGNFASTALAIILRKVQRGSARTAEYVGAGPSLVTAVPFMEISVDSPLISEFDVILIVLFAVMLMLVPTSSMIL
jgi:hypothetical protein